MMASIKKLIKVILWVIVIAVPIVFFTWNIDIKFDMQYWADPERRISVRFWQVVLSSFVLGVVLFVVSDFVEQIRWSKEKRRIKKAQKGHDSQILLLTSRIDDLESENRRIQLELELKSKKLQENIKPASGKSTEGEADPVALTKGNEPS